MAIHHALSGELINVRPLGFARRGGCRSIMNCTEVCPKGLAPSRAIESIRLTMAKEAL